MEKFEILGSEEELIKSLEADAAASATPEPVSGSEPSNVTPEAEPQYTPDDAAASTTPEQSYDEATPESTYSESDMEFAVVSYLSERLGRQLNSIDDLFVEQTSNVLDERVEAIARFVQETGREPEDWFRYQALNPSEMDDMTAIRIQMAADYPNLSYEEINLLLGSKYKLDPEMYDEQEVKLSQLQMKIDATTAKQSIEKLRSSYSAPQRDAYEPEPIINDAWVSEMRSNVNDLEGVEFDLGNGNTFTFGIDDSYKGQLLKKNENLGNFFDSYVRKDGSWDYDLLSSHMTVIDNIDSIVRSVYQKGLGDGQKGLVNKAANVSVASPQQNNNNAADPLYEQLSNILGVSNTLTFKI